MFGTLNSAVYFTLLLSLSQCVEITLNPEPDEDGKIPWKTDIVASCSWDIDSKAAEFLINTKSYNSTSQEVKNRISLAYSDKEQKEKKQNALTFRNVMAADNGLTIGCMVMGDGSVDLDPITVAEPPVDAVSNVKVEPDYNTAKVTYDALEGATVYRVSYKSNADAEWTKLDETDDLKVTLKDLTTATDYHVKVIAGNKVGFRDDAEPTPVSFTTLDNREPLPVGNLEVEHPEPNATSVTLTWDLADNEEKGIKIDDIMISISTINDTLKLKIAGDATNFTKDGLVFGNYEFEVRPLNDFSTKDKVHEMVEVTVEEKKVEPVELEDKDDKVKEEQDIKALLCDDYSKQVDVLIGESLTLTCELNETSEAVGSNITWVYDNVNINDNDKTLDITTNNKSSTLVISAVSESHKEIKCTVLNEKCTYPLNIKENSASRPPFTILSLFLLLLLGYC